MIKEVIEEVENMIDEYQKRKDQQRGAIGVLIGLLVVTGALLFIGILTNLFNGIGGKFSP